MAVRTAQTRDAHQRKGQKKRAARKDGFLLSPTFGRLQDLVTEVLRHLTHREKFFKAIVSQRQHDIGE